MKTEVSKVRLVLNLEVVRGRRWRELAPFREAVLFHFSPQALRSQVVALSEAVADQILEEVTEAASSNESGFRPHLQAVMTDLQHGGLSLEEVVASHSEEMDSPKDREASGLALRLAEHLKAALAALEELIGEVPEHE